MRKRIDFQMRHTAVSMASLVTGALAIPFIHFYHSSTATLLYGTLLFMGWITGIILGQTFKTLPFIVWNDHYKNLTGKFKLPLPRDLYSESLLRRQFWTYVVALILLSIAIVWRQILLIQIATWCWLALAVMYVVNVSRALFH